MLNKMVQVFEKLEVDNKEMLAPMVRNELNSFVLMLLWIKDMQQSSEMDTTQARIHIDIQRHTMRTRLMSFPGITLHGAEDILNQCIDVVRKDIFDYLGWIVR